MSITKISVVIVNYNYENYVRSAIESALALEWKDVEIIVVDDGSTDHSIDVIREYADRTTILTIENSTQRVAANRGFALTTGDVVIFLDSDDILPRDLPRFLRGEWTTETSKAQFRMQRIDTRGHPFGVPFPDYVPVPSPTQIRKWAATTTAYPTPPGSGNAYSRWYLDAIFPVGPEAGDAADSACLAAAPFLGDVISIPQIIVKYRRHHGNDSNLLKEASRFSREVHRARSRWIFAQIAQGLDPADFDDRPLRRSRELLQLRVAACRFASDKFPLPGDRWSLQAIDALKSPFQPGPERLIHRLLVSLWCVATLTSPRSISWRLTKLRYGR